MADLALFWRVIGPEVSTVSRVLIAVAIVVACQMLVPWLSGEIVDASLQSVADHGRLNTLGIAMISSVIALFLFHGLYLRAVDRVASEGGFRVRQAIYRHVLSQPISYFRRKSQKEIMRRAMSDVSIIDRHLGKICSVVPLEMLSMIGVTAMMAFFDVWLTVIILVYLFVTFSFASYLSRSVPVLERRAKKALDRFAARQSEIVNGIKTVKTFVQESKEIERLDETNRKTSIQIRNSGLARSFIVPLGDWRALIGIVLVIWYGAFLIAELTLTVGGLVAFVIYASMLVRPVSRLSECYQSVSSTRDAVVRVSNYLTDAEPLPEVRFENGRGKIPDLSAPIVFDHVSILPDDPDLVGVNQLSFTLYANETIALVGRDGAGHRMVTELLQRFYAPQVGGISAGGVDLCEWDQDAWRSQLGVISQDVFLFNDTIEANVFYSQPHSTPQQLERAIELSGLYKVLRNLPKGIKTVVGDKGFPLTYAQRQRVALARLFLHDPTIVIYDEPIAVFDDDSMPDMVSILARLSRGRITVLISQQLEIIKLATRVVLMDRGEIIAMGGHDDLLTTQPLYRALVESMQEHQRRQPIALRRA